MLLLIVSFSPENVDVPTPHHSEILATPPLIRSVDQLDSGLRFFAIFAADNNNNTDIPEPTTSG